MGNKYTRSFNFVKLSLNKIAAQQIFYSGKFSTQSESAPDRAIYGYTFRLNQTIHRQNLYPAGGSPPQGNQSLQPFRGGKK